MANYPQIDDCQGVWKLKEVNNAIMGGYWRLGGARGIFAGGKTPTALNVIDFITIASTGNATDFGDLLVATHQQACLSSHTRGIVGTGNAPSLTNTNIGYITMASAGDAADFGDVTVGRASMSGASNSTRGVFLGGLTPTRLNVIDYITINSLGNAVDFGNLTHAIGSASGIASPTRALNGGGNVPVTNVIASIEIATTGNATDFGDLVQARNDLGCAGSSTRGVFIGGDDGGDPSPANVTRLDFVTIASQGNSVSYGDLSVAVKYGAASSNSIRGIYGGGDPKTNVIEFFEITAGGNAVDFGDLTVARTNIQNGILSQAHGGLNDGYQGTRT